MRVRKGVLSLEKIESTRIGTGIYGTVYRAVNFNLN